MVFRVVRSMDEDAIEKEKESFWLELKEFSKAHILEVCSFSGYFNSHLFSVLDVRNLHFLRHLLHSQCFRFSWNQRVEATF